MQDHNVCRGYYGRFKRRGLRMTLPRQVILQALEEGPDSFMTAEDVFMRVHEEYPGIGLATVYRTINLLADMGVVTKLDFGDGKARFELSQRGGEEKHHHLLICSRCFRVVKYSDFEEEEKRLYEQVEKTLEKKYEYDIQRHVVQYYGVCPECKQARG